MSVDPNQVISLAKELLPQWERERARLTVLDEWESGKASKYKAPRGASPELKALIELARTPYLKLVVGTVAQALFVDGYRSPSDGSNTEPWQTWLRNDQESRQTATHRSAVKFGYSFETVLPGQAPDGARASVIRGVSPRGMYAVWQDPASDDFPMFALQVDKSGGKLMLRLFDEEFVHFLSADSASGGKVDYIEYREHNSGVTPVVRFAGRLDIEGRAEGEVEPFISVAGRIDKTAYDRLMVQHFASWKVRTIAGMRQPDGATEAESERKKLQLRQDDILVADDPDTRFGTLDETPLDGFISAHESDVEALAVVSQTPTYALTGNLINLSADAISEARGQLVQKIHEYKIAFGASHDRKMRLAALQQGDRVAAFDFSAHVTWQDTETRSLSQAADALGKMAEMLGVPVEALWQRIPGVTQNDVEEWKVLARQGSAFAQLQAHLEQNATAADSTVA